MKTTLRKTLALLLCLCMCLSLVPAAFAEEGAFGEEEAFSFEEPAFGEEPAFTEPAEEEPAFAEEPFTEEPAGEEEPFAEEPAFSEEPAEEQPIEEEPAEETPAEEPIVEEPVEEPAEEPAAEAEPAEEPAFEAEEGEDFDADIVHSGTWGSLSWSLDSAGKLTITGSGKMKAIRNSYGYDAWSAYRTDIKSVVVGSGVTSIGDDAFYKCSHLTIVTIPASVTSVGIRAFSGCSSLTNVTLPGNVTSISNYAFYNCSSLTGVTIPNSVTSIGNGPFSGCSSLTSIQVSEQNPNYCSVDGVLFDMSTETLIQYPAGKSGSSYTVPNSVTSIGYAAFSGCSGLTDVTIPDSVTSIGSYAFYECSGLTSVTIPDGVTEIGNYALSYCSSLTSVTIPNGVTSISKDTFYNCSSLTSVTIPNSVTEIGSNAFYCTSLRDVYFIGTQAQWDEISIGNFNDPLTDATLHLIDLNNLPAPTLISAAASGSSIVFRWNAVPGAAGYRVYRKYAGVNWTALANVAGTSYTDANVTPGTVYTYTARCLNAAGQTVSGFNAAGKSGYVPLPTPTLVSAAVSGNSIVFKWNAVNGAAKYRVYRKYAGVNWTALANVSGTSYTDTNVAKGTVYTYTVRCVTADGKTCVSGFNSTGKSAFVNLPTPTLVSAAASGSSIVFKWNAVNGAAKYRVYRKYAGVNWTALANVSGTSYTDSNVAKGTVYTYTVRCVTADGKTCVSGFNAAGKSAFVNLPTPTLVSAAASGSSIVFKWNAVNGAAKYRVYRKTAGGSWTALANVAGTTYTDTNVTRGTTYTYTVRCVTADGKTCVSGFNATGKSARIG